MWRSLLFVPPLNDRLVNRASTRGADAIVLDLEAAVPPERKEEARGHLKSIVPALRGAGATVAVRINPLDREGLVDIEAAMATGPDIIVLPRATPASTAQAAAESGEVPLIPIVEDPRGVIESLAIAEAANSVVALGFGVEDYAAEMGAAATPGLLVPAAFQVIQAARAAGREPLVIGDTIADYKNLNRFESAAVTARASGASGGFAIHPGQVEILNRTFTPTEAEESAARAILEAADAARREGHSIAVHEGRMIDAPIEAGAKSILARTARYRR